jgi:nicotinate-nucleotide adenylyltransferase
MHPDAELILLMGTDMFLTFQRWRCPEKILAEAALGVFYRGDRDEKTASDVRKAEMEAAGHTVHLVCNDVVDISSTDLRRMLVFRCAAPFLNRTNPLPLLPEGAEGFLF